MNKSIDLVIFDLGGVLIDIDFQRSIQHWADAAGQPAHAVAARYGQDEAYRRHERGELTGPQYFDALRDSLGIAISEQQFAAGWNALLLDEVAGIRAQIQRAREHVPVCLFSNSNALHYESWGERHKQMLALFQQVFVSNIIGKRKPDAEAFQHVLDAMGVSANRALFFDDTQENIDGAARVGIKSVLVKSIHDVTKGLDSVGL